jgi:hypothetical protein
MDRGLIHGANHFRETHLHKQEEEIRYVVSCRIFEHFAIILDPVTEFIKFRSALHKQGAILALKQADLLSILNKRIYYFHLNRVFSDLATLIWIHAIFVLYKHVG